jgi:hypothetical protein
MLLPVAERLQTSGRKPETQPPGSTVLGERRVPAMAKKKDKKKDKKKGKK